MDTFFCSATEFCHSSWDSRMAYFWVNLRSLSQTLKVKKTMFWRKWGWERRTKEKWRLQADSDDGDDGDDGVWRNQRRLRLEGENDRNDIEMKLRRKMTETTLQRDWSAKWQNRHRNEIEAQITKKTKSTPFETWGENDSNAAVTNLLRAKWQKWRIDALNDNDST